MDDLREAFSAIQNKLNDLFNRVNQLEAAPTTTSGSGGGAPVDAQYLTLAFNALLTQERRLDFSASFSTVDGGANADFDVDLSNTGVGAGAYGSATQVGTFTVDAQGRLTNAANIAISGVPPSAHNLLNATYHGDTVTQAVSRGSLIYGNVTPAWDELTHPGLNRHLQTDNNDVLWREDVYLNDGKFTGISGDVRVVFDSTNGFIEATLGDDVGVDEFQVVDSGNIVVASIDSDGQGYLAGNTGIGISASTLYRLYVFNNTLNTDTNYYGFRNYIEKIAGASDINDIYRGTNTEIIINQNGGTVGFTIGEYIEADLTDGTVGSLGNDRYLYGAYMIADLNSGTIYGDTSASYSIIDQEVGNTVNGNLHGHIINVDADGTVSGSVYMLRFIQGSNVDYTIYSPGNAPSYHEGFLSIGTATAQTELHIDGRWLVTGSGAAPTTAAGMYGNYNGTYGRIEVYDYGAAATKNLTLQLAGGHAAVGTSTFNAKFSVDQSSTTAAIPTLILDQADLSEEFIDFVVASTGAGDPVDTVTAVGAAYARLRVAVNGTFKYIQLYNA